MIRLSSTILHEILSAGFCDAGLKNEATALLVVVDAILRLTGGGETSFWSEGADRFRLIARIEDANPTNRISLWTMQSLAEERVT